MDFLGKEIKIGDYVAFARNPYSDMILGKVVGFTKKGLKVIRKLKNGEWNSKQYGTWEKEYETILPYQCAKINYNDEEKYELIKILNERKTDE